MHQYFLNWNWLKRYYQHNSGGNNHNYLHNADKGKSPLCKPVLLILSIDEIEKELALYKFKYEMALAEKSIEEEGTISADELEVELGVK